MSVSFDLLDRRVLAGFRIVDPLGRAITDAADVTVPGAKLLTKQPGHWVVLEAGALPGHDREFSAPPAAPSVSSQSLAIEIKSHSNRFLSRSATLRLPRDANPANRDKANSLFRWADIVLPFASAGAASSGTALVSIQVTRDTDDHRIEGAVVRLRATGLPEQIGMTNSQGEAHLVIPAVPLAISGGGASVTANLGAQCDAIVDPAMARFHAPDALLAAKQAANARRSRFVDPDELITRLAASATAPVNLSIASGTSRAASIAWSPP